MIPVYDKTHCNRDFTGADSYPPAICNCDCIVTSLHRGQFCNTDPSPICDCDISHCNSNCAGTNYLNSYDMQYVGPNGNLPLDSSPFAGTFVMSLNPATYPSQT